LGLNKKSMNHASLSELGRHPLHYNIVKSLLKYCYRLENLTTEFPLLKDGFFFVARISILHTVHLGTHQLINYWTFLMFKTQYAYNKSKFGFILRKCLNQIYLSDWKDTSESLKDGKLTTYLFLKTKFKL
jgi:hypothetical protein